MMPQANPLPQVAQWKMGRVSLAVLLHMLRVMWPQATAVFQLSTSVKLRVRALTNPGCCRRTGTGGTRLAASTSGSSSGGVASAVRMTGLRGTAPRRGQRVTSTGQQSRVRTLVKLGGSANGGGEAEVAQADAYHKAVTRTLCAVLRASRDVCYEVSAEWRAGAAQVRRTRQRCRNIAACRCAPSLP